MIRLGASFLLVAALGLTGCGSDDPVTVSNAWARASAPGQQQGAIYFDLTVADDDRLVGVAVPPSVAVRAEVHEVVMDDEPAEAGSDDMDDDMEMEHDPAMGDTEEGSGMMRMQELADGLALSGGETVSFEPGSYHVMLPELAAPLVTGEEFELTLDFAEADDVTVTVLVADSSP